MSVCLSFMGSLFSVERQSRLIILLLNVKSVVMIFTALHRMQMLSSDENSVRPSVKRVHCGEREKDLSRFLYHTKEHLV